MAAERTYFLGTHDEEIERLGLQHGVWRPTVLDCWRRAGIGPGSKVLDVGAGPGFASADLSEIVGPDGVVVAVERSARFVEAARSMLASHGFGFWRITLTLHLGEYVYGDTKWLSGRSWRSSTRRRS